MKTKIFNMIIILITFFAMLLLIFFTHGISGVVRLLQNMNYFWLAAAFVCMVIVWFMEAAVLHYITLNLFEKQRFMNTFKASMICKFFDSITPFSTGGQPAQIYQMVKDGVKPGHAVSIAVVKSTIYQISIVLYSVLVIVFKSTFFISRIHGFFYLYLIGLMLNLIVVLMWIFLIYKRETTIRITRYIFDFLTKIKFLKKLKNFENKIENELKIYDEGTQLLKNKVLMIVTSIFLQSACLTIFFAIPFFIYLSMGSLTKVNIWNMVATQSIVTMISSYVPTPGSSGAAEGTGYIFFSLFFMSNVIIPIILIWRIITFYSSVLFGGLYTVLASKKPAR